MRVTWETVGQMLIAGAKIAHTGEGAFPPDQRLSRWLRADGRRRDVPTVLGTYVEGVEGELRSDYDGPGGVQA